MKNALIEISVTLITFYIGYNLGIAITFYLCKFIIWILGIDIGTSGGALVLFAFPVAIACGVVSAKLCLRITKEWLKNQRKN